MMPETLLPDAFAFCADCRDAGKPCADHRDEYARAEDFEAARNITTSTRGIAS
jgi:hypothetical protein